MIYWFVTNCVSLTKFFLIIFSRWLCMKFHFIYSMIYDCYPGLESLTRQFVATGHNNSDSFYQKLCKSFLISWQTAVISKYPVLGNPINLTKTDNWTNKSEPLLKWTLLLARKGTLPFTDCVTFLSLSQNISVRYLLFVNCNRRKFPWSRKWFIEPVFKISVIVAWNWDLFQDLFD